MIDVLLAHSNHVFNDRKQIQKMQPYPPLQTLLAASVLRRAGFTVASVRRHARSPGRDVPGPIGETSTAPGRGLRGRFQLSEQDVPHPQSGGLVLDGPNRPGTRYTDCGSLA